MFLKKNLALFCLVFFSFTFSENICTESEQAYKAYENGNYDDALDLWKSCSEQGFENADLYYNLGNTYFRNGKLGFSIYYYKKALQLKANDEDIIHNLKYAESMTKDKIDDDDEENPLLNGLFKLHHAIPLKKQLWIILVLFWIIILGLIGQKLSLYEKKKNIFIGLVFFISIFFFIFSASVFYKIFILETDITGVVTATDADVTSAPNEKSQTLNTLSEGTSFQVLSIQGNFAEIKLGEKIKGFVRLSDVGILN